MPNEVHIIGGGLAGSEAAFQLLRRGIPVVVHEMRGVRPTPAHRTDRFAELVCSNSFRSDDSEHNAVGLLHQELRQLHSLVMAAADGARLPAGSALAVDRDLFSACVSDTLERQPLLTIRREEVSEIPPDWGKVLVATGPLTSDSLACFLRQWTGDDDLAFFDAIAPIVHADSIDYSIVWRQSRYDRDGATGRHPPGEGDYLNCPLDRAQYEAFVAGLLAADTAEFHAWERETPWFEGCMPIEAMAARGPDTLRFGPMKPVGLRDPRTGKRPWAVVQLRQDNEAGTLYNLVGFQTKTRYGDQLRLLRTIPGLEQAEFARLGGIHRNSFLRSPVLLDSTLALKADRRIRFAGQITGCEGYVESAAVGLLAALFVAAELRGQPVQPPPAETALGALLRYITGGAVADSFQPMNVNFGLFPPLAGAARGRERKAALAARARAALAPWAAGQERLTEEGLVETS